MLLLTGTVETRTLLPLFCTTLSVTAWWIELTKLAMMKATATGAATAAAIVAVRPGSRTRLARPSRDGAPLPPPRRRHSPMRRGAKAPLATMKAADAMPTASSPAGGCHFENTPSDRRIPSSLVSMNSQVTWKSTSSPFLGLSGR